MNKPLITQVLGYIAGSSVIIVNIPQIYTICKNKSAKDVSLYMILLNIFTGILFLIYGILLEELPLIICETLYIIVSIILLIIKIYYNHKNGERICN